MTRLEILEYEINKAFEHTDRLEQRFDLHRLNPLEAEVRDLKAEVKGLKAELAAVIERLNQAQDGAGEE